MNMFTVQMEPLFAVKVTFGIRYKTDVLVFVGIYLTYSIFFKFIIKYINIQPYPFYFHLV